MEVRKGGLPGDVPFPDCWAGGAAGPCFVDVGDSLSDVRVSLADSALSLMHSELSQLNSTVLVMPRLLCV